MNNPAISVVIPAFNEEAVIEKAVRSVKSQEISEPVEILVINNDSTDDTASIARKAGAAVITESHKGLAYARARGVKEARGEYTVFMDADSHMPQDLLKKSLDYFAAHPDVVGLSCGLTYYDARFIDKIGIMIFNTILVPFGLFFLRLLGKPDFLIASYIICKTEALRKGGGIDMDFPFFGDDTRISMRLGTQGKVRFLTSLRVQTSARRLQKEGILATIFRYWSVFLFLHFVSVSAAKSLALSYSYKKV